MLRCNLTKSRELELIILMSLMTLLDKSNDGGWKRDPISTGVQEDIVDYNTSNISRAENNNNSIVLPIAYEDPIPKKSLQKKYKVELVNDQKLQLMLEKDVRRSQKQIQSDQKYHKSSLSAGNSPAQSPKASPLPTPSTSTSTHAAAPAAANDTRLKRQKSASALLSSNQDPSLSPTSSHSSNNGPGRLTRLFSSLSHMKQTGEPSTLSPVITSPAEKHNKKPMDDISSNKTNQAVSQRYNNMDQQQQINREKIQQRKQQLQQQQMEQEHQHTYPYYNHQLSLPTGGQMSRLTDEFGKMSTKYDSPPSLRSIRWNPEPPSPIVTNNYPTLPTYHAHRSNSGISRVDDQRRMSASEYPLYSYHHASNQHHQYGNYNYNNRYSTSEYYIRRYHQHDQQQQQQQQQQYDYYP